MGVYINMEMPKNCGDCKAFVCYKQWAGDMGDCFCGITKNDAEAKKKNADCPLVPVPPHGRLIDADELKGAFCGNCFADEKPMECSEPCMDMRIILETPTIIPAEENNNDR